MENKKSFFAYLILTLCFYITSLPLHAAPSNNTFMATPNTLSPDPAIKKAIADDKENSANAASIPAKEFIFKFERPIDEKNLKLYEYLEHDGSFVKIITNLNDYLKIPENVNIEFENTDIGPHYIPNQNKLVMSYDMVSLTQTLYQKNYSGESQENMHSYVMNVNQFFMFHEIGHALIDVYQLPVIGDEESTADNLAVLIALELNKEGWDIVVDAADFFDLLRKAREDKQLESAYWDEHKMDSQRYYYILCLAYGKFPQETKKKLDSYNDKDLQQFLQEKGDRCKMEYETSKEKWFKLLKPHLKKEIMPKQKD